MNNPNSQTVVVPREPTRKMLIALMGNPLLLAASDEVVGREAYRQMLEAAPKSDGPAERDAVLEEAADWCDKLAFEAFDHKVIHALRACGIQIRALKNAAPQVGPSAGIHSGEDFQPARASSEAGKGGGQK